VRLLRYVQRLRDFLLRDLWHLELASPSRAKAALLQTVRVFVLAGRNFVHDRCPMRSTSLAFVTLLSLVPLLAFAFSVLKGFDVGEKVKPWLIRQVVGSQEEPEAEPPTPPSPEPAAAAKPSEEEPAAPAPEPATTATPAPDAAPAQEDPTVAAESTAAQGQKQLVEGILTAIDRTDVRALGTIGLLFLLWTTIKLLGTIEGSFNYIWNVTRSRTFLRKITDYVSVLVIAPILLVAAMSLTAAFQSNALVARMRESAVVGPVAALLLSWLRYGGTWIAFTFLYLFMPNTRVRWPAGILGGIVGGTIWQVAFWAYTHFQIGVAKYGAIYTTFAAIPIFMVWLYFSWTIVLFGAEVAHAFESVGRYWEERRAAGASFAVLEALGLRAMIAMSAAFYDDGRGLTVEELAERCKAPGRLVSQVLQMLAKWRIAVEIIRDDGVSAYHPGRTLEKITPADVLSALRHAGQPMPMSSDDEEAAAAHDLLERYENLCVADLGTTTFRDIAARLNHATSD